jgi:ribose transport system substrate-binding protein
MAGYSTGAQASTAQSNVAKAAAAVKVYEAAKTKILQTVPLKKAPPTGKVIIYLVNEGSTQSALISTRVASAAKLLGWTASTITFDPTNPASLDAALMSALQKGANVVSFSGYPISEVSASVISAYKTAHVSIVLDGAFPCAVSSPVIACVDGGISYHGTGMALADWFVSNSDGKGKAILLATPGLPILDPFAQYFQSQVKKLCPGCSVITANATLAQVGGGTTTNLMLSTAEANPTYKYLIFNDGAFGLGINSLLSAAHLSGFKIAGEILQPEQADALRSGTQSAWTASDVGLNGYNIIDAAARYFTNSPGTNLDLNHPFAFFVKSNIGNVSNFIQPGALQAYAKLWKAK